MSVLLEKNGTTTAEVTMINARGILLFVGGKEYYLSYDRYPWFRNAKVSDVLDVTMPDEESLRWDAIDVDLEIDSIIHPERHSPQGFLTTKQIKIYHYDKTFSLLSI